MQLDTTKMKMDRTQRLSRVQILQDKQRATLYNPDNVAQVNINHGGMIPADIDVMFQK